VKSPWGDVEGVKIEKSWQTTLQVGDRIELRLKDGNSYFIRGYFYNARVNNDLVKMDPLELIKGFRMKAGKN